MRERVEERTEMKGGKGLHIEKRIEFREEGKERTERRSQEQAAIITTDPPWYSVELVY